MDENFNLEDNIEIKKALEEFELKEKIEQTKEQPKAGEKSSDTSRMIYLVMKWSKGAIKDEQQAEYVLLGVVVIFAIVSAILFMVATKTGVAKPTKSAKDIRAMLQIAPQAIVR
jgi:hypothetical protein